MFIRFLLMFGAVSIAAAQTTPSSTLITPSLAAQPAAPHVLPAGQLAPPQVAVGQLATPQVPQGSVIRFEDSTDKAGIDFTHSFGSRQLGSLLEGTGAGCVWFDYNNDGLPDLYVVNGRPLDDSMHPYPLKEKPTTPPHNHLYRNEGNGRFSDVTA